MTRHRISSYEEKKKERTNNKKKTCFLLHLSHSLFSGITSRPFSLPQRVLEIKQKWIGVHFTALFSRCCGTRHNFPSGSSLWSFSPSTPPWVDTVSSVCSSEQPDVISSELFNRILFNRLKFPSSYHFLFSCRGLTRYLNVLLRVRRHQRNNETVPVIFEQNVKKHPNKVCFIFEGREYTFKEVNPVFKLLLILKLILLFIYFRSTNWAIKLHMSSKRLASNLAIRLPFSWKTVPNT